MNPWLPAPMPEALCFSFASPASRRLQTGGAGKGLEANQGVAGAPFSHFFLLGSLNGPATPALPEGFWRGNGERGTYRSPVSPECHVGIFWFQGGGLVVPKRPLVGEEPRPRERPRIPHPQGTRIVCGSQQRTEREVEGACQQRTMCWKVRSRAPARCFSAWNLAKPVTCFPLLAAANIAILAIGAGAGPCFPWFHLKERWKILWDHQAWAPVRALSGPFSVLCKPPITTFPHAGPSEYVSGGQWNEGSPAET